MFTTQQIKLYSLYSKNIKYKGEKKCDKNRESFEINQSKSSVDVMVQMQTYLCDSKCTRASVDGA